MRFRRLVLLALAATLGACGPYAVRHRVLPGEDLAAVARRYRVPEGEVRAFNGLEPGDRVRAGDIVFVPGPVREPREGPRSAAAPAPVRREAPAPAPPPSAKPPPAPEARPSAPPSPPPPAREPRRPAEPARSGAQLDWPAPGTVLRGFGVGPTGESRGIDVGVPAGTPVRAAGAGRVTYAGAPARAYGTVVIVEHPGRLFTVYGNLGDARVRVGEAVTRGEELGPAGARNGGIPPHYHFEVRRGDRPVDPLLFLPTP